MSLTQNFWMVTFLEKQYYFSPYLIFNGIGLILGLLLLEKKLMRFYKKDHNKIYILYVLSIVAGWIGAHLFDSILKDQIVGNAGFTFLGGLLLGSTVFCIFFKILFQKDPLITALNTGVMPLVLGHAIGRIGCFFSGCCFGKEIAKSHLFYPFIYRHPTQLYESVFLFVLFFFLKSKSKVSIYILDIYIYLIFYSTFRFFIEFYRGDYRGIYWIGLSPSQWISIVIFIGTIAFMVSKNTKDILQTNKF